MKGLDFPIVKTKPPKSSREYDLTIPSERKVYFLEKVGKEITELAEYMKENKFIAYLLGKKQAGKGTYTKMLIEIFGEEMIKHLSIGDLVRSVHESLSSPSAKDELINYLSANYRGFLSIEDALEAFMNRDISTLVPTEFILALVKREIEHSTHTNLFIDGFPRNLDQITYSLYFRELINQVDTPDIFVLFDVSEAVINERIKYRRICAECKESKNLVLNPTTIVEYRDNEFVLKCDNPTCSPVELVTKEGDDLGIESIRDRLEMDDDLIRKAFELHGVPKIFLRNAIPKEIVDEFVDDYEITKGYEYFLDDSGAVKYKLNNWSFVDDNNIESVSLMPAPVVVEFIKRLHEILVRSN